MLFDSPRNIDFHVRTGDYFSYLATMIGFLEEALAARDEGGSSREKALARELRTDLRYVQANYAITPRPLEDIQIVRPSGNILERKR